MFRELITIFKRVTRQKVFFGINLIGLSIGLIFSLLAFLFGQNEFRYDQHFSNTENTYLLACNNGRNRNMHYGQPAVFMDELLKNIPELEHGIRVKWADENLKIDSTRVEAIDFIYTDPDFFSFLGWELLAGDQSEVLASPMSITISENMALQLFKNENPLGKIVNVANEHSFIITGIFKELPDQSHIKTDFIASISSWEKISPNFLNGWGWHSSGIYLKLNSASTVETTKKKIADIWNLKTLDRACTGPHIKAELQPFNEIYLKSGKIVGGASAIDFVIGFSIIAALILIISCFNFINLSIAISSKRSVENGIKKVLGATSRLFLRQIVYEMLLYLAMALAFCFLILNSVIPYINSFIDKKLSLSIFENPLLLLFSLLLICFLLIVCGGILLFQITQRNTLGLLKGTTPFSGRNTQTCKTQIIFRNSLIVAQFTIGILLVIASLIVNNQLKLIRQHSIGFDKEQVLVIDNYEGHKEGRYNFLSNILKQYPEIQSISSGSNVPLEGVSNWGSPNVVGNEQNQMEGCGFISVDYNYLDIIRAEVIEGRNFIAGRTSDKNHIIINEALAKALYLENPVGTILGNMWDNKNREIIGLVKNIEFNTIHNESVPVIFFCQWEDYIGFHNRIIIKLQGGNLQQTIEAIEQHWSEISPDYPMNYMFLDDKFNKNYEKELQTAIFLNVMTAVAVILCCMGLFGLALFHINARIKEIGIRKVNGAKTWEVMALLNRDFVIWVAIAFVIATPIAWYAMNRWLQNFAYKTELSWWIFALAGLLALGIALLTVSWQSWRAARRNPVEALRYE